MCPPVSNPPAHEPHLGITVLDAGPTAPPQGSRRRRLWELDGHAHCPVIGVCLPMAALRRLVDKAVGPQTFADDYELHCVVVTESKRRTRIAEVVQRELDRRYAIALRHAAALKTTEQLAQWWADARSGTEVAGALWAVLTHARCTPALAHAALGDMHMLQHQVGMATRADLERLESLIDENAVLARELGAAQRRSQGQAQGHARQLDVLQTQLVRLRAELLLRDTALAQQQELNQALEQAAPQLRTRFELAREARQQAEQIRDLQRALLAAQQEAERQRRRADEAIAEREALRRSALEPEADAEPAMPALADRAVLCVGGRAAIVPVYRRLVEHSGARFMHHDGGEEDAIARLDATLAAADLVICQTGCISHDAYWRVKDHCKRTGKRCVFVDTPSRAALERALGEVSATAP
ncbi:DUF2325 domain-containing protein [Caldimonas sp. KR1-144]|uniref:DUF2325 domain-containing protein n=1 Tax=Caldimonas sp. KR1-144 TaxID=3400911 RepID=UPI003C0744B7